MRGGTNLPLMGGYNQAVVLDAIRRAPLGVTRADVARATGLSAQTVSNVTKRLLDDGFVVPGDVTGSGPGRPGQLLVLDAASRFTVGVHLDPAAISLVVLDLAGAVVGRHRVRPPRTEQPAAVLAAVVTAIDDLVGEAGIVRERVLGIGVAVPGPVDLERGVVVDPPHLRDWRDVPVRDELVARTGLPVVLDKDVIAAASAHLWYAESEGPVNSLFVYLGTGVAMSAVVDGEVVRGASGNAGEVHHLIVDRDGPECSCGRRGCLGAVISASALVRETARAGAPVTAGAGSGLDEARAADRAIGELAVLARDGDARVLETLRVAGARLAVAVTAVSDLLDLDAVMLAGSTWSRLGRWIEPAARAALEGHRVPGGMHGIAVLTSPFGEEVGSIGAASLMLDEAFTPRPSDLLLTARPAQP